MNISGVKFYSEAKTKEEFQAEIVEFLLTASKEAKAKGHCAVKLKEKIEWIAIGNTLGVQAEFIRDLAFKEPTP